MTTTAVRERPILFSGPMVRAILDGKKNQTRRVVKPQPPQPEQVRAKAGIDFALFQRDDAPGTWYVDGPVWAVRDLMDPPIPIPSWTCPYGQPGDLLWAREAHILRADRRVMYRADFDSIDAAGISGMYGGWKPSIHMPRWASRLTLELTDVRVQRVQEISEEGCRAEGIWLPVSENGQPLTCLTGPISPVGFCERGPRDWILADYWRFEYANLWDSLNAKRGHSWESNPWVWCLTFRRVSGGPPPETQEKT